MQIFVDSSPQALGEHAASHALKTLREALASQDEAFIIVATGASQFETIKNVVAATDIDWSRVTVFHLDEYIGLPESHPASFRRYLRERFVSQLPTSPKAFHAISGEGDAGAECERLSAMIADKEICLAMIGIGENGHLAFNDPPADFETTKPYIVVELDEACRRQQMGEGWFPTLDDVPSHAISMSVHEILKAKTIVCSVPDERKAQAVHNCIEGEVSPLAPASALQNHPDTRLFLDEASASQLSKDRLSESILTA